MNDDVLISVIIPTRNRCALLRRAVDSVRAQTHAQWELLVVDDGSDDGSREMLTALGDARIRIVTPEEKAGSGSARWHGAEQASGDYIAYLDSDDYWLKHKLATQLVAAQDCPCADVVVVSPPLTLRGDALFAPRQPPLRPGERIADYVYAGRGGALQTSCLLVSGELGRRVRFNRNLRVNQDTDYVLELEAAGAAFVYLDEHLYVQDANDRGDRISANRALQTESLAWFRRVSGNWSKAARRGYYLRDLCIRVARQGRVLRGLWYFLKGIDLHRSPYFQFRQLLRVLGGGDVPAFIRRLGRRTGISRGQRMG